MSELISCPNCRATNPGSAEWCGQCFTRLVEDGPLDPDPETIGAPAASPPTRTHWECKACGHDNEVQDSVCAVCGTTIFDSYGAGTDRKAADPEGALRRAIIFPGFGYPVLGLGAIGAVVGFLAVASAIVGVMMLLAGETVGLVLLVVFLAIWAVSIVDVVRMAGGERTPLLRPRVLSIVGGIVVAVLLLTVLAAFQSATS